ncbi:MAG: hypothetical protein ACXWL5_04365 [Candidatus Chromulinivorax sp.]
MKKSIYFLFFLQVALTCIFLSLESFDFQEPTALCLGDIIFNQEIDPDLCLYYKGNKLQLNINHDKKSKKLGFIHPKKQLLKVVPYTFHETKSTQKIHILICEKPHFTSDSNTIHYLHVPKNVSYKFYTLTGSRKYNKDGVADGCLWTVSQEVLQDGIVPDDTVVFLFNADFIEGLEVKSWPLNSNLRLLPSIIIRKDISQHEIERAILQARIVAMDFDVIHHRHVTSPKDRKEKTVLALKL